MYGSEVSSRKLLPATEAAGTPMSNGTEALHHLVPTYRRDTAEVVGAVRRSAVEFIGMEQMPGGKFQITCRTMSGADAFISPVRMSLAEGQANLEIARRSLGGEDFSSPSADEARDQFDAVTSGWNSVIEEVVEQVPIRTEPRLPTFAFADIEAPELPTSVF